MTIMDPRCVECFRKKLASLVEERVEPHRRARTLALMWEAVHALPGELPAPQKSSAALAVLIQETGDPDPFLAEKRAANELVLSHMAAVERLVSAADDPFDAAVRVAMAGNSIDVAAPHTVAFETALARHVADSLAIDDIATLRARAAEAKTLLYLTDNAGEIILDRLFLEALGVPETTIVVRGGPAWNDALLEDAQLAGLPKLGRVIDNGDSSPGTVLEAVRPEVRELFERADLVVSKGQGNYETLATERREGLFFVLLVKCEVVAEMLRTPLGAGVVLHAPEHPATL